MLPAIEEIKHNLDGTIERFDCYLVHRDPHYVVLSYLSDRPYMAAGVRLPAGSLTIGHYRRGAKYIVWEMYNPQAELLGYYVHLCGDISLSDRCVEWHDMTVDVWLGSDGRSEILDEDELERSVEAGQIDPSEADMVRRRARRLRDETVTIARDIRRFNPGELLRTLSTRVSQ